jgi:hypothetical protein
MIRSSPTVLATLMALALLLAACGETSSESTADSSASSGPEPRSAPTSTSSNDLTTEGDTHGVYEPGKFGLVTTNDIVASPDTGCAAGRTPSADGTACLSLSDRAVTSEMVQAAELSDDGTTYSVLLTLTSKGASQYNTMATSCVNVDGRCTGGTVAAVWNGIAVGGSQVTAIAFDQIKVAGLDQSAAEALLDEITVR